MKPIRDLIDALVERRLWPVALLLVVGLVAVPVALSKKAAPAAPATPVVADTPGPVLSPPSATVVAAIGTGRDLASLPRTNPFAQHRVKVAKSVEASTKAAGTTAAAVSDTATATTGTGSTGTTTTGTTTTPTPSAPAKTYLSVSVDLSFGRIGHSKKYTNLARLSALPSTADPVVIYLGVMRGTKTAVFLISSDVHPSGDGHCFPSAANCQTVHVAVGGSEFFDVFSASGASRQYELDLTRVSFSRTHSKSAAARSFLRVATGGPNALKASGARLGVRFDRSIGRLVTVKQPAGKATRPDSFDSSASSPDGTDGTGALSHTPATSIGSLLGVDQALTTLAP
jgi:hypothetical protein